MTSSRKLKANRANARRSSGPRSVGGKERSAKNAMRHNLSVPVMRDVDLAKEVRALAVRVADDNEQLFDFAVAVAEAQVDLDRVRWARAELIRRCLPPAIIAEQLAEESLISAQARVLALLSDALARVDRYERRALSRRKFAIRRFDTAQNGNVVDNDLL